MSSWIADGFAENVQGMASIAVGRVAYAVFTGKDGQVLSRPVEYHYDDGHRAGRITVLAPPFPEGADWDEWETWWLFFVDKRGEILFRFTDPCQSGQSVTLQWGIV